MRKPHHNVLLIHHHLTLKGGKIFFLWPNLHKNELIWKMQKNNQKNTIIWPSSFQWEIFGVRVIVFNTTFNNISVILWWSVLLVEETGVPGENQIWFFMSKKEIILLSFHWKNNALDWGKNIALPHLKVKWSVSCTLPLQSNDQRWPWI